MEQAADSGVETTIQLTENIEGLKTKDIIEIPDDAKIILDMNGKTISTTNDFVGRPIKNNGCLTITGNGTIDSSLSDSDGYGAIDNYGELVIENGTFTGSVNARVEHLSKTVPKQSLQFEMDYLMELLPLYTIQARQIFMAELLTVTLVLHAIVPAGDTPSRVIILQAVICQS